MDSLSSLFGGSAQAATPTGGPATTVDNTGASAFDYGGSVDTGSGMSAFDVSNIFSNLASNAFDPTGSLGAEMAINPPSGGSPDVQSSTVGGTQSDPQNQGNQGQNQPNQQNQPQNRQYAPDSAVQQLKKALQQLSKGQKQQNPYEFPQPQPQPTGQLAYKGQPAPPAPPSGLMSLLGQPSNEQAPNMAGAASIPTGGANVDPYGGLPGKFQPAPNAPAGQAMPFPQGEPGESAVGDPSEARTPPPGQEGRNVTVPVPGAQGAQPPYEPSDAGAQPDAAPQPGPPTQPPQGPQAPDRYTGPIMRDVGGGQSIPPILPELAMAALSLLPLFMGRGRSFGGFHHGGQGHWPYFHPGMGWQFHGNHPGVGWMPMHPMHMREVMRGYSGGDPFSMMMSAIYGGTPHGQQDRRGMRAPPPNSRPLGDNPGYVRSGNRFTDALTGIESPQGNVVSQSDYDSQGRTLHNGGNPYEISQGHFQIQNYPGGTWQTHAAQAGVDLNKYPNPMSAPYEVQHQVARTIPFREWGKKTRDRMHQQFNTFPDRWTLGQLEDHFGKAAVRQAMAPQMGPEAAAQ